MKKILLIIIVILFCSCSKKEIEIKLPAPEAEKSDMFSVDKNINMSTIDKYLFLKDVAYRDVRMLFDTANFSDIGGDADLSATIEGFKIVPYPYIASLQALPVGNAYSGDTLFDVEWDESGNVISATPLYNESMFILRELFPMDKSIFIMCGGGGYANMMKLLLIHLGWDENKLYNIGANWNYKGKYKKELVIYPEDVNGDKIYASWRADYAYIPFEKLNKTNNKSNSKVKYTHFASGGLAEDYDFEIIFEESNSTFTAYQVAYSSCTCRDEIVNFKSICYVEILNTRDSGDDAAIRYITFSENKGLFGDSNPNYNDSKIDEKYYDIHLIKPLIGVTKREMDKFAGYGYCIDAIDVDAMTGATVTRSNLQSMLKSLFNYHKNKYYNGK